MRPPAVAAAALLALGGCTAPASDTPPTPDTCTQVVTSVERISKSLAPPSHSFNTPPYTRQQTLDALVALQMIVDHPECYTPEAVAESKVAITQLQQDLQP